LLATRTFFIDGDGNVTGATPLLRTFFEVSQDASDFLEGTLIQFAGVVIRRKFYEQHGGFQPVLVHTADYEMWIRAISLQGGVVSPTVGAGYRIFDGNDTSKLRRSGENIFDYGRCAGFISEHFTSRQMPEYWHFVASQALQQIAFFSARGDYDAVRMSAIAFRKSISRGLMLRRFARQVRKSIRELRIGVVGR
jgi:hypothetical protein